MASARRDPHLPTRRAAPSSSSVNRHSRLQVTPSRSQKKPRTTQQTPLNRHGTLLSPASNPVPAARRAAELKTVLGNTHSRLPPKAAVTSENQSQETTLLEQAKNRARVEVDIALRNNICVEGGFLSGLIKLRIRSRSSKEPEISLGDAKLRIIGIETVGSDCHEFFQHSATFSDIGININLNGANADSEGFFSAKEGTHKFNFNMHLPIKQSGRSRGVFRCQSGTIRYIALASIKVKDEQGNRSIAHFFRDCQIYPRFDPATVLAPAQQLLRASNSGMGISMTANLHREYFVAGTSVPVEFNVHNGSGRVVKSVVLTLYQTIGFFKRKAQKAVTDMHVYRPSAPKSIASSTLEMSEGYTRRHASAAGWWPGIHKGEMVNFSHMLLIPPEALSYPRGRLIEVNYTLKATLSCGTLLPDLSVTLPIRIINFLSLDPPPSLETLPPGLDNDLGRTVPYRLSRLSLHDDAEPETAHEIESASDYPTEKNVLDEAGPVVIDAVEDLLQRSIFAQRQDDFEQRVETISENVTETTTPCDQVQSKQRLGPPAFAQRVQNKLNLARQSPLDLNNDSISATSSHQAVNSSFLNDEYLDEPPPVTSFKRDIGAHPKIDVLNSQVTPYSDNAAACPPTPDTPKSTSSISATVDAVDSHVTPYPDIATTPILAPDTPKFTPSFKREATVDGLGTTYTNIIAIPTPALDTPKHTPSAEFAPDLSTSSVKDRVKAFEQRLRPGGNR